MARWWTGLSVACILFLYWRTKMGLVIWLAVEFNLVTGYLQSILGGLQMKYTLVSYELLSVTSK